MLIIIPADLRRDMFLASFLLFLLTTTTATHGQEPQTVLNEELTIRSQARQIKPGLYECMVYVEAKKDLLDMIDDVRYTLPTGYSGRKQSVRRIGDSRFPFSSKPIITTDEVVIKVKIDFHGRQDVYLSHKIKLFSYTTPQ